MSLNSPHTSEELDELQAIMSHPLLKEEPQRVSFQQLYFNDLHKRNARLCKDVEGEYQYTRRKIDLFESIDQMKEIHWYEYVHTYGDLILLCVKLKRYDEFCKGRAVLEGYLQHGVSCWADIQVGLYYAQFVFLVKRNQLEEAFALRQDIEEFLQQYQHEVEVAIQLSFFIAFAIFLIKVRMFREALSWIGKVLNVQDAKKYARFSETALMLNLISYYELHEYSTLESCIRSTYRFLKKKERLHAYEQLFLRFLRQASGVVDKKELTELFRKFREELLQNSVYEGTIGVGGFDLITWLESKMNKRPFIDLLREKEMREEGRVRAKGQE